MSKIETFIDKQKDLTIITLTGEITTDEIIQKIEKYYSKDVTKLILWDFSEASLIKITSEEVQKIALLTKKYSEIRKGGKTTLVFVSDLGFGLGRVFEISKDIEGSMVARMIFRDKQEALQWLSSSS
ncbi:MAG: hypothetical protein MUP22_10795 [Desulfobacterales bacterium]|nr:hypothetical protein [Desulfobacterales bacterium]